MDTLSDARVWAEVDSGALAHNISLLRQQFQPARVMAVVKADAYGHGISPVVPFCVRHGLREFGVATATEGVTLRRRSLLPETSDIYLLGPTLLDEASAIVAHRLTPLLSSVAMGQALSDAARLLGLVAEAHLDVDTGIGRAGIELPDAIAALATLDDLPNLRITGLATHFACADEDLADTHAQWAQFADFLSSLGERANSLLVHASNSPASLVLPPEARHGMIRPGLLLYGIEPTPNDFAFSLMPLRPVLSLKTRVTLCRALPGGATISYGRTYTVPPGGGVYATLGVGYGDGYPRRLSNSGYVLIQGRRAPICGRVCMDQTVVDVSHIPGVKAGDIATLIGTDDEETITAGGLAAEIGTTPHEITTCLTARVSHRLVNESR